LPRHHAPTARFECRSGSIDPSPKAKIKVTLADLAGNSTSEKVVVKLKK
jgi:hypothetical protein